MVYAQEEENKKQTSIPEVVDTTSPKGGNGTE